MSRQIWAGPTGERKAVRNIINKEAFFRIPEKYISEVTKKK